MTALSGGRDQSLASQAGGQHSEAYAGAQARPAVDADRLCAWLQDRSQARSELRFAIYQGLIARVRRGDFDVEIRP